MQNIVIRSEINEIQFGLYSSQQIHELSCCEITSPIAYDGLGNAISHGLYDPKLGPTSQSSPPCVTCGMIYMNCPGHPGHIDLCVPVCALSRPSLLLPLRRFIIPCYCQKCLLYYVHSVLIVISITHCSNLSLIVYSSRLRVSENKIRIALIKLKLIEMGMVKESNELEDLFIPPAIFNESAQDAASHLEEAHKKLLEYEARYMQFLLQTKTKPSAVTVTLQREVLDAFQKSSVAVKKCESCGAFSPSLRKDGYTKLFEKPLQKKQRKSMQGMKLKLKVS